MENKDLNDIEVQIAANNKGLEWIRTFLKGGERKRAYETLIANRRELKRIRYAWPIRPAAAVYGESQVGKSYLVDCLLSSKTKGSLQVYDGHGVPYGFIEKLNPYGRGGESTSLVSRFTTRKVWTNDDYPIKAIMLLPVDIILTLCDSYYNDLRGQQFISSEILRQKTEQLRNTYGKSTRIQTYIEEDDVYELKEYFQSGLFDRGEHYVNELVEAGYFDVLAEVVPQVPVGEWKDVFAVLWGNNRGMTETFTTLIAAFEKLGFRQEVYISMDAVLRTEGTLLCVDRIYELFGVTEIKEGEKSKRIEPAREPDLNVLCGNTVVKLPKSVFCALAAELIFKIDDALADEKTFLKQIDLLDFPGARSRKDFSESAVTKSDSCEMLLRGKVAYLFNKYSTHYLISSLLFCHHEKKSEVTPLSTLLSRWVSDTIGDTPEKRAAFISDSVVSPLFIIGTKFNIDLKRDEMDDKANSEETERQALDSRWNLRFSNTLLSVIGENRNNRWFSEWISKNGIVENFKNIYLLRSYEYSQREGGIFEGYLKKDESGKFMLNCKADGTLVGELDYGQGYAQFLTGMKKSFVEHPFVREHFADPSQSWDEAASLNKDGSEWIIENLTIVSKYAFRSRENKFRRQLEGVLQVLCHTLKAFYHDDRSDQKIQQALERAGMIDVELDKLFGSPDRSFFSQFIQAMLVKEEQINDLILGILNEVKKIVDATDLEALFAIRDRAKIDSRLSKEENLERVRVSYHFTSSEKAKNYLEGLGITMEQLMNPPMIKNFATVIAEDIENYWFREILNEERFRIFIDRGFPEERLADLLNNLKALYRVKLHFTDNMVARIHKYVENPTEDRVEMLADICSEMINRFVNDMGTSYYSPELWQSIRKTVEQNKLDVCLNPVGHLDDALPEHETIAEIFDVLNRLDDLLKEVPVRKEVIRNLPNYRSYRHWTDLMKISFIAVCDIPTYDVLANDELRDVLTHDPLKTISQIKA